MVADIGRFAGRVGDVHVVVEDTHGESDLCQLLVAHDDVRLETFVFGRTHAREVHAVFRLPVMLLQVAQVVSHHGHVRTPVLQSDEHAHADGVYAGLPHAVEPVDTPFELRLHAARMVHVVAGLVVCFLETDYAVQSVVYQFGIFFRLERHHLDFQVREVRLGQVERFGNVGHTRLGRILTRHNQQVFERAELLDGLVFVFNFFGCQDGARHGVADVEAAVHARVGARVGDVERDEHRHGASETLFGIFLAEACHGFKELFGSRRDERHEVVYVAP